MAKTAKLTVTVDWITARAKVMLGFFIELRFLMKVVYRKLYLTYIMFKIWFNNVAS